MTNSEFKKMTSTYNRSTSLAKFEEFIRTRLVDIQRWHELGWDLEKMEEELGLGEHELFYMTYFIKIKELKKIFKGEKNNVDLARESLIKKANGYYVYKEVLCPVTKTWYENGKKCSETHYEVKQIREYIPKDTKALEFLLSNKLPNEYQIKGKDPENDNEESINSIKNILISIREKANESK